MPINPTTLKALIDTQITNETVDFAITPAEVGGRMKDTIDYTTEQKALSEVLTNKSTNVNLGTSDTLYPTQNAVKTYVQVNIADTLFDINQDLADLNSIKENIANKSTNVTTDGASNTKYPSVKAVKDYVDANSGSIALTIGNVTGVTDNTAILIYGINSVFQTSSDTDKVVLPETDVKIGDEIYVFCEDSIRIRGNVAGGAVISTSLSTNVSVLQAISGDRFRFTKISSLGWTFEKLEGLNGENIVNKSTNVTTDGASNIKYPSVKAVKDYVDANAGGTSIVKSVKVSLSSSQILNLFTTPIEVVPAVSGKVLILRQIFQKYTFVSTSYTIGGSFRIGLGEPDFAPVSFFPPIQSSDNAEALNPLASSSTTTGGTYINLPLVLGCITSNPTDGDGTLDLYITYFEITI